MKICKGNGKKKDNICEGKEKDKDLKICKGNRKKKLKE